MALQPRNALILATPDAEILSLGRLGEHLAFKDRVALAVLLSTQTAFTVAHTELRAFGQSSSDTQQTEESIPKGKGLFWACSGSANCIPSIVLVAQPELVVDQKGRTRRIYRRYQTPLETLLSLPQPAQYLRAGFTVDTLKHMAAASSDTEAARRMQEAKRKLFDRIASTG